MSKYNPKISILTPSYNQGKYIEENILSVLNQNYPNFEHIIVDGGSTDNTVEILKKYPHLIWISEKDDGQADALNKGLKMATGDIIGWINSDDYYLLGTFQTIEKYFSNNSIQWLVGNLKYYYSDLDKTVSITSPKITYQNLLQNPDIVKQQSTFFRKQFIEQVGGWNKKFYMVMDFDLWFRLAKISEPLMINEYLAVFVHHPEQKTNPKNIYTQTKEIVEILFRENASIKNILKIIVKKTNNLIHFIIKYILIRLHIIDEKYYSISYSVRNL